MTHLTEATGSAGHASNAAMDRSSRVNAVATPPRIAAGEVIPCWRCGQPVTTDYWQRGYQAGVLAGRTQTSIASGQRLLRVLTVDVLALLAATALLLATGWPWIAVIAGVLTLVYGGLRWWVNAHVKRLRTHLKEDQ